MVAMTTYTAVFERDATGWWYVTVPALAGCHTQGPTLDQARTRIREALALWLETTDDAVAVVEDVRLPEAS